jgi:hypothetical protein
MKAAGDFGEVFDFAAAKFSAGNPMGSLSLPMAGRLNYISVQCMSLWFHSDGWHRLCLRQPP